MGLGCCPLVRTKGVCVGTLLVASGGLLGYAKRAEIARVATGLDLAAVVLGFVDLVEFYAGALPDDLSVVLCHEIMPWWSFGTLWSDSSLCHCPLDRT